MANINKELNQIKNAVYGREVRQAIHDGIEQAYNDATSGGAGDTDLEVVLARGDYDALNKRLNASDEQLADTDKKKMDKNTRGISVSQIDKNKGLIDESYLSDELKEQMTGNTPIGSVPADDSITTKKIVDKSVTPNKASFISVSTNLIDKSDVEFGYLIYTDGLKTKNNAHALTGYIDVIPGVDYSTNGLYVFSCYDEDKGFIRRYTIASNSIENFKMPSDTHFVRFNIEIEKIEMAQFNLSKELLNFETYYKRMTEVKSVPNLKMGMVNSFHTGFISQSTNLFNGIKKENNHHMDYDGSRVEDNNYFISDYIDVIPGMEYTTENIRSLSLFDSKRVFLARRATRNDEEDKSFTMTMPKDVRFVKIDAKKNNVNVVQLIIGDKIRDYSVFKDNEINAIGKINPSVASHTTNLLDSNDVDQGFVINGNGERQNHVDYVTSNFIEVNPFQEYSFRHIWNIYSYDADKRFISRYSAKSEEFEGYTFTISADTYYIKVSIQNRHTDSAQINSGEKILEYEPFLCINKHRVAKHVKETFSSEVMEDTSENSGNYVMDRTLQDWYDLYDDLVDRFPSYVKKRELGKVNGKPINLYVFNPESVPDNVDGSAKEGTNEFFKVFMTSSHGHEKASINAAYNMFKQICEGWGIDPVLEELRWNIRFSIIPIVCPYGFENNQRKNENGVDILRNFPNAWEIGSKDTSSNTYRGESPLSEKEAELVYNYFVSERWDFVTDFHNFFSYGDEKDHFVWVSGTDKFTQQMGQKLIRKMTNKWKIEYDFLPQSDSTSLGFADLGNTGIYFEAKLRGIPATLTEISSEFPYNEEGIPYDSTVNTAGVEVITNWIYSVYRNLIEQ